MAFIMQRCTFFPIIQSINLDRNEPVLRTGFLKIIDFARKVADKSDLSVVILGETGTGKGLIARVIHEYGKKSSGPFVDITCSAIPENLVEERACQGFTVGRKTRNRPFCAYFLQAPTSTA